MKPDYEIVLGQGIGEILFGIPKAELADMLGAPDDIEIPEDPEKYNWETYSYNTIKCSFTFDPDRENRLVDILVENGYFHIGKKIRVGLGKEELLNFGKELKFGEYLILENKGDEVFAQEFIYYQEVELNLWMDRGIITAIQISPARAGDGTVIWPESVPTTPSDRIL